ncbi:3-oxoacyl-[acyl-carrier-protein] reductase [Bacillus sp. CH30_1T]|uniref:3-oxoacyl-[acyl-carrier-protein] reductase n=1 Tax=Bacillus sp. CH30_1T TaxID=2604836 RepID=UPI0011EC03AE|nr:3-oxoacyl-[acyl-carrier-protein] reductase [Bacillus sp. CH30_1T]KAA0560852.1 3-oxoacyl-[acyl-carrier-protein] reductase [Bacillus sp. CH30_1T]
MFKGDEVAVVTGASKGIGKAVALELASQGVNLVLTYVSSSNKMDETLYEIKNSGGNVISYKVDVSNEKEVKQLFKDVKKHYGRLDILVNNSGITKDGFLPLMSSPKWDEVINVNLRGTFLCSREAVKQMMISKSGTIVNIASTSGISGAKGQTNYSASKGGIISFTKSLALEASQYNIRANVVAPGFIETDMTKAMDQTTLSQMMELVPLRRMGKPQEVANLVSFLSSEKSSYITGKVFTIDGGLING